MLIATIIVINLKQKINIEIKYSLLAKKKLYLFSSILIIDTGISIIALMLKVIIIDNSKAILFANFGIKAIKIPEN